MELLNLQNAVILLALIQIVAIAIFALKEYYSGGFSQDIDTSHTEILIESLEDQIDRLEKEQATRETRVVALESQFAELHEFVNRGIKRMSTRAARAEELFQMNEDLHELEDLQDEQQTEMFDPNRQPKLVRNSRT